MILSLTEAVERSERRFGDQCDLWLIQAESYPHEIPLNVIQGIAQCGR